MVFSFIQAAAVNNACVTFLASLPPGSRRMIVQPRHCAPISMMWMKDFPFLFTQSFLEEQIYMKNDSVICSKLNDLNPKDIGQWWYFLNKNVSTIWNRINVSIVDEALQL